MNEVPPGQDPAEDADDLYRRASALDPSRPSESVRRRVLEHAEQLAAERAAKGHAAKSGSLWRAAHRPSWRPAIFGTLAAVGLAGLLIAPHFYPPSNPVISESPPAPTPRSTAAEAPAPLAQPGAQALSMLQSRDSARSAASPARPVYDAKTAPVPLQEVTTAQNMPASGGGLESAAQDARRYASSADAVPAPPAQMAARAVPAARPTDAAAELRRAAEAGDVPQLRALLDRQTAIAIDARDDGGRTALMLATLHGQNRAVDVLLAHGADPNVADASGTTPLQAALAGGQPAIASALKRAGAR